MFQLGRPLLLSIALLVPAAAHCQFGSTLPGKPYVVTRKTVLVSKLSDGTTITTTTIEQDARDSQGRTLQGFGSPTPSSAPARYLHMVTDPAARETLTWYEPGKEAYVSHFRQPRSSDQQSAAVPAAQQDPALRPKHQREDLPATTIGGIYATGFRYTTTYPVGSIGNDQPIVTTQETWESPDLKITLRSIISDPRTGTRTTEITDLSQTEPDPSLFHAPEGYTIKRNDPQPN